MRRKKPNGGPVAGRLPLRGMPKGLGRIPLMEMTLKLPLQFESSHNVWSRQESGLPSNGARFRIKSLVVDLCGCIALVLQAPWGSRGLCRRCIASERSSGGSTLRVLMYIKLHLREREQYISLISEGTERRSADMQYPWITPSSLSRVMSPVPFHLIWYFVINFQ